MTQETPSFNWQALVSQRGPGSVPDQIRTVNLAECPDEVLAAIYEKFEQLAGITLSHPSNRTVIMARQSSAEFQALLGALSTKRTQHALKTANGILNRPSPPHKDARLRPSLEYSWRIIDTALNSSNPDLKAAASWLETAIIEAIPDITITWRDASGVRGTGGPAF